MSQAGARDWRRSLLAALGGAAVLLGALSARGETFHFRDPARSKLHGKVLAEFDDTLFVVFDGQGTEFVPRSALSAIEDERGKPFESRPTGAVRPTPAGAATDALGKVWLTPVGGKAGLELGASPVFLNRGDRLKTGPDALVRVQLRSNAELKVGPATELLPEPAAGVERLKLARGELFVHTRLQPLEISLAGARLQAAPDTKLELGAVKGSVRVLVHGGRVQVSWSDARLQLEGGDLVELTPLGPGRWRVSAGAENTADVLVQLPDGVQPLSPGASQAYGEAQERQGDVWRLLTSVGELLLRRAGQEQFKPVPSDELELLVLGDADALRTAARGSASLGRIDGATVTLGEATHVRLDPAALELVQGEVQVEAVAAVVALKTPAGIAPLRQTMVRVRRRDVASLDFDVLGGGAEVPLHDCALAKLEAGSQATLSAPPQAPAQLELRTGAGQLRSRPLPGSYDPGFQVSLAGGDVVAMREDEGGVPSLGLPGGRWLRFETAGVEAAVRLGDEPHVSFPNQAQLTLREGLTLGLARSQELPQLRFRSGPRLRLATAAQLQVHNPTARVQIDERQAQVELEGDLDATLTTGSRFALAALTLRERDQLEVPVDAEVSLERTSEQHRYDVGDGRRLWIQDGAPPVQARLADAAGTLFLSMPGAPALGLPAGVPITVLATANGEFVVVSASQAIDLDGLQALTGPFSASSPLARISQDRLRDLLDVPPVDSPSGP